MRPHGALLLPMLSLHPRAQPPQLQLLPPRGSDARYDALPSNSVPVEIEVTGINSRRISSSIVIDAVNRIELINFAVHPKGHGVVSKIRIPKGTVVGEYYGEVYPAWRWAEKQAEDEAKRAPGSLPDFWNIRLDRPREDRKGYDVLYVYMN